MLNKKSNLLGNQQAFFNLCPHYSMFGVEDAPALHQELPLATTQIINADKALAESTKAALAVKKTECLICESKDKKNIQSNKKYNSSPLKRHNCNTKEFIKSIKNKTLHLSLSKKNLNKAKPKNESLEIKNLKELKRYLDLTQIKECLINPYCAYPDYPLVDPRELMPSFEVDPYEHKSLHGFAMVALQRELSYFDEIFQYDTLFFKNSKKDVAQNFYNNKNLNVIQQRLPRSLHEDLRQSCAYKDLSSLEHYPTLLPFLLEMDRAQVMALDDTGNFRFLGINASFPSDLDTEVKNFGLRIGKFSVGNNEAYESNRTFVLQFLMELYGYPMASERRTSSALFARKLHKLGEPFMIRALGQTDRVLTSLYNFNDPTMHYPQVEKVAIVGLDLDQVETMPELYKAGYFLDEKRRAVILRVRYCQHLYSPENVRQDRALSVLEQALIHPRTGKVLLRINILKDTNNMFLQLNDIVRGEHRGRIVYKRQEVIVHTDTEEKRLKFLYAWLVKHQRRFISYRDEYFSNVAKVVESYLFSLYDLDSTQHEEIHILSQEVQARFSFIQQARKVKVLEDLKGRIFKGERVSYLRMLEEATTVLQDLKFELVSFFDQHVSSALVIGERILNDRYLINKYINKPDLELTAAGLQVKKKYGRMVGLLDELASIRKIRQDDLTGLSRKKR